MNKIKLSFDSRPQLKKPYKEMIASINNNLGRSPVTISKDELKIFAHKIGAKGHTFCPATFKNQNLRQENYEQQQLFALDFDNKDTANSITFDEVKQRADFHELPILFAYETLSSENQNKFRVVFINDVSVDDIRVAKAMQLAI